MRGHDGSVAIYFEAASYLTAEDWRELAAAAGYRIDRQIGGAYRSGMFERLFPNRLEVTMRLVGAERRPGKQP